MSDDEPWASGSSIIPYDGPFDVDAILAELNRHPFAEWPVQKILDCPQPKVYTGARQIFAMRVLPYLKKMMRVLDEYDVRFELPRLDFIIDTMDNEMATLIDAMGLEPQTTNVLLGYCAGAKKLKRAFLEGPGGGGQTGKDVLLGLGASVKIQADVLQLLGFRMTPRQPGSPHPLAHERIRLP
jgi:hypothetical protein